MVNDTEQLIARPSARFIATGAAASRTRGFAAAATMGLLMAALSFFYTTAMFPGLEWQSGYQGNSFLALHPDSFPGDRYMQGLRPTQLSLFYALARAVGEPWLDDRVGFVIAWMVAIVSLIALDRTIRLFGATRISERVALWSVMLLEHRVLLNHARLIDMADVNPTMLAGPVALWLLYTALAGSALWIQGILAGLLMLISPKVAAMPVLIAVMLLWKERFPPTWRRVAGAGCMAAALAGMFWSQSVFRHADGGHVELFQWIIHIDGPENNPFVNSLVNNVIFAGLCAGVFALRGLAPVLLSRVRAIAGLGLVVWLSGGLYLSFAPEWLQSPHLALIGVARSLWWVQYTVYVAYGAWALKEIQQATTWARLASAWALLIWLTLLHMFFRGKTAVAIVAGTAGAALWSFMRWRRRIAPRSAAASRVSDWPADMRVRVVAVSLCLATFSTYALGTVNHRRHDLAHLVRHGVMGGNPSAKWLGINEYLRTQTPASASVLALSMEGHPWSPRTLRFDGWLRSRSGRTMPVGPKYSFVLDPAGRRWHEARVRQSDRLVERWMAQDAAGVAESLAELDAPDYVVVPNEHAGWIRDGALPYAVVATIRDFTIMEKQVP